ncbi:MAG: HDOD domain-containing protein, partial [Phycisphaerales bacterium]
NAQLSDYAKVIKTDHAISGRVLKLANSPLFGQRVPVTTLERSCLVLGLERLKAVTLGFYLSRTAMKNSDREFSRKVWGQSVLRACLAGEAARVIAPGLVAEAFVIGLILDAALPLMQTLIGPHFEPFMDLVDEPSRLYASELRELPFTHADAALAMARMWKLPDLLARPIAMHHVRPAEPRREDPVSRLHRVAYVTGVLEIPKPGMPVAEGEATEKVQELLGLSGKELSTMVARGVSEYGTAIGMFNDVAAGISDPETLIDRVQVGLVNAVDAGVQASVAREIASQPVRVQIGATTLEVRRESDGHLVALVLDSTGRPLISHRVMPSAASAEQVCEALGVRATNQDQIGVLSEHIRRLAA